MLENLKSIGGKPARVGASARRRHRRRRPVLARQVDSGPWLNSANWASPMVRGEEKRRGSRVGREHGRIDCWILGIFERRIRPSPRRINYRTLGPTFNPIPLLSPVKLDRRHARIVRFRDPLAFVWLLVKKEKKIPFLSIIPCRKCTTFIQ